MSTTKKRADSNRTEKSKKLSIERRNVRRTYAKNGGRF